LTQKRSRDLGIGKYTVRPPPVSAGSTGARDPLAHHLRAFAGLSTKGRGTDPVHLDTKVDAVE
jgi:hypothetical protein